MSEQETVTLDRFEDETVWESDAKNHNGVPYMKVKQRGNYVYSERLGTDSVAFILLDANRGETPFGLINERKPPLDERLQKDVMLLTAFGGSIDMDKSYQEIVQTEVKEEAGYEVPLEKIVFVGDVMVSTQSNQMCHLYFVDVTGIEEGEREPETAMEAIAEVTWTSSQEVMMGHDWKAITIIGKMMENRKS